MIMVKMMTIMTMSAMSARMTTRRLTSKFSAIAHHIDFSHANDYDYADYADDNDDKIDLQVFCNSPSY